MAQIISTDDLPVAVQSAAGELLFAMVDGANAKASRVAPCLVKPLAAWAAATAYAVGDRVTLTGGEALEVTVAGTSAATVPSAPIVLDGTVVDGTVTWKRIGPTADQMAEAVLILIGAVSRWSQAGSGSAQSQTVGPYSMTVDTRQRTGFNLWPSEIADLQAICKNAAESREPFAVDTVPCDAYHSPICSLYFGGACSCGVDIAGAPIFEPGY